MVLQIEVYAIIIKVVIPGIYIMFPFDHFYGSDRGRSYKLNGTKMTIGYVREQRKMHPTHINQKVGYLGMHEKIVDVGDEQNMVLQESNNRTS